MKLSDESLDSDPALHGTQRVPGIPVTAGTMRRRQSANPSRSAVSIRFEGVEDTESGRDAGQVVIKMLEYLRNLAKRQ